MTALPMFQVDAFSDRIFGGNPAAVLILDAWLPEAVMQGIAAENNLAETAFVRPNGKAWDLRWFTPVHEARFCGHATLAAAHILATEHDVGGAMTFNTKVGELRVARSDAGYQLDLPSFPPESLRDFTSLVEELFDDQFIPRFQNFENIFVELPGEQAVRDFVPDVLKIIELHPFGLVITGKSEAYDFVSRYFVPGAGIPEDPVTGSIHATLVPYWAEKLGKNLLSAFQCSQRGGHLICELKDDRVLLTGQAVTFMKAEIYL
jgi:PhzF family phenazine biosynthesis protein